MAEFQVRSDAVDVEQIMRQIRARIREKRGADYTEQEIRDLASVKLEKFLDPRGVRSNLVEEFRRNRVVSPDPKKIEIGDIDIYGTHRGLLRAVRTLLNPLMKMLFNPTPLIHAINTVATEQNAVNAEMHKRFRQREEMDPLYYEVIHNLVVELTRLSIENNNLKMRVESLSSRMDFDERRARALESVVAYKPAPRPGHVERPQSPESRVQGQARVRSPEHSTASARRRLSRESVGNHNRGKANVRPIPSAPGSSRAIRASGANDVAAAADVGVRDRTWRMESRVRRVQSPGSRVQGPGSRVQGPGSRVQSPRSRVQSPMAITTVRMMAARTTRRQTQVPMIR